MCASQLCATIFRYVIYLVDRRAFFGVRDAAHLQRFQIDQLD